MVCDINVEAASERYAVPRVGGSALKPGSLGKRAANDHDQEASAKRRKLLDDESKEQSVASLQLDFPIAVLAQRVGGAVVNALGVTSGAVLAAVWSMSKAFGPGVVATLEDTGEHLVRRPPLVLMKDSATQSSPPPKEVKSLTWCEPAAAQMYGIEGAKRALAIGDDPIMRPGNCQPHRDHLQLPQQPQEVWRAQELQSPQETQRRLFEEQQQQQQERQWQHQMQRQQIIEQGREIEERRFQQEAERQQQHKLWQEQQQHQQMQMQIQMGRGSSTGPQGPLPPSLSRSSEMTKALTHSGVHGQDSCGPLPAPVSQCNVGLDTSFAAGWFPISSATGPQGPLPPPALPRAFDGGNAVSSFAQW